MPISNFAYVRPKSLKEAFKHLSSKDARVSAGGTDLLGCLRDDVFGADKVVSIGGLDSLRGIAQTRDGGLRIGALVTLSEVGSNKTISEKYPALAQSALEVASPQLRNQGTLGGNICQKPRCWYYRGEFHCMRKGGDTCFAFNGQSQFHCIFGGDLCYIVHPSDTASALVALDAMARIAGPGGARMIPLGKFHVPPRENPQKETVLKPNEILTEVLLPPPGKGQRSSYRKVRARRSWDFALAGLALVLQFDGNLIKKARVVLSGAAPVPWRCKDAEEAMTGKHLDSDTVSRAADAVVRNAQPLKHNAYKIPLFRGVMEEELLRMTKT